ncbi:MAG TPA: hypothetical protein VM889_11055 [Candidatus Thermoplasmatota archaeon]|nr:hypothetical protein [Candidatus Thermoplasmatota archaeon]
MAKFTKNHMLEIGLALTVVGLLLTVVSWSWAWDVGDARTGWLASYEPLANFHDLEDGDYNLIPMIVGPIVLIMGLFYAGEQLVLRRRFERLMEVKKKGDFLSNLRDIEALAKRLPDGYRARVREREAEMKSQSRRST